MGKNDHNGKPVPLKWTKLSLEQWRILSTIPAESSKEIARLVFEYARGITEGKLMMPQSDDQMAQTLFEATYKHTVDAAAELYSANSRGGKNAHKQDT